MESEWPDKHDKTWFGQCGQGWGGTFSRGDLPQLNSVGSGVD